jgi:alpha-tubulin suppressor-like RCC1 family protein
MAMKEVQYINNYPICDTEARSQLANKEDKGHKHEEYATSAEVQQIFNSIDINDFDMSDFATKEDVEDAVANIKIPEVDLSNYATKNYVAEQLANADPDIDLSDYALKSEIPKKISQLENDANYVTGGAVEEYVTEAIKAINLEEYQTKNDSNLQTESKTIVGAINELLIMLNQINNKLEEAPEEIPTVDFIVNGLDSANSITLVLNNSNFEAVGHIYGTYTPIDSTNKIRVVSNAPSIVSTEISKQKSGDFTIKIVGHAIGDAQLTLTMGNIAKTITVHVISNSGNEEEYISDIKFMTCGDDNIYIAQKDGNIWTCGQDYGQLESASSLWDPISKITEISFDGEKLKTNDVKQIACGNDFVFVLKQDGTLWAVGNNSCGQLGLNHKEDQTEFKQIVLNVSDVKQIACGYDFTFILKNNGTVWATGNNQNGQLGLGDKIDRYQFEQVIDENIGEISEIICGYDHTFLIKSDRTILGSGCNCCGELATGSVSSSTTFNPISVNNSSKIQTPLKNVICGNCCTYILDNAGKIWAAGNHTFEDGASKGSSTLFIEKDIDCSGNVIKIAGGYNFLYALCDDGTLWSIGDNSVGQLGLGNTTYGTVNFTQVKNTTDTVDLKDVKDLFCAGNSAYIIRSDGSLWSVGKNDFGQLGLRNTTNKYIFNRITDWDNINEPEDDKEDILYSPHVVRTKDYTYILKEDNTLWESDHTNVYFGSYNFKQRMTDVKKVAGNAEGEFCMVLKNDGTLWAKGKNEYGQLGLGNTTTASSFTQVTTNTNGGVIDVACGDRETMIIKTDYSVWVCGQKCFGLKNESNLASFTRVTDENIIDGSQIKKIVMSGDYTSCFVLKTDGVLWGCGNDGNGQLGSNSNYGGGVEDFIQIPNMTNVKDIVTSRNHSVLLKNDGTVWGTGMNTYGALGHNPNNYPSFRVFTQIPNIDNVVQIATGKSHTVALKSDGSLMGTGNYDALGMPMPSSTSWYNNFKNITYGVADPCEIYGFYNGYFYVKEDGSVFKNNSHAESNGPNDYEAGTIDLKIAIK